MLPNLGTAEMMVIMVIAVLLFGKRLPEVGRSLGKGIIEFKKALKGIDEDEPARTRVPATTTRSDRPAPAQEDPYSASIPKFEPPSSAPVEQTSYESQPYQD
jgi:sec-independent protein translocase protein TatA